MPKVTFLQDGVTLDAADGEPLADVAERASATIPFSCRDGTCGTCLIEVKRGASSLSSASEKEKTTLAIYGGDESKHRLTCQCRVVGDDDIDVDLP
jgi:2Fe-2S ferredoxin